MTSTSPRLLFALLLPLFAGCSETHADVVGPYVTELEALTRPWSGLARDLAGAAPTIELSAPLAPRLVLDAEGTEGNAEVLALSQLKEPLGGEPDLDLQLSASLLTSLEWTRPERRDDDTSGGDPEFMRATLEDARSTRYLIVYSVDEYRPARVVEQATFEAGRVSLDVAVLDLEAERIVARFPVRAESSAEVSTYAREGDAAAIQSWLRSDLWSNAREALASALREAVDAEVRLD